MLLRYKNTTGSWRYNDVENASPEVSLTANSAMVEEGAYHLSVVIFTKDNMDLDKPVPVVNTPHMMFIGGPTR